MTIKYYLEITSPPIIAIADVLDAYLSIISAIMLLCQTYGKEKELPTTANVFIALLCIIDGISHYYSYKPEDTAKQKNSDEEDGSHSHQGQEDRQSNQHPLLDGIQTSNTRKPDYSFKDYMDSTLACICVTTCMLSSISIPGKIAFLLQRNNIISSDPKATSAKDIPLCLMALLLLINLATYKIKYIASKKKISKDMDTHTHQDTGTKDNTITAQGLKTALGAMADMSNISLSILTAFDQQCGGIMNNKDKYILLTCIFVFTIPIFFTRQRFYTDMLGNSPEDKSRGNIKLGLNRACATMEALSRASAPHVFMALYFPEFARAHPVTAWLITASSFGLNITTISWRAGFYNIPQIENNEENQSSQAQAPTQQKEPHKCACCHHN